MATTDDYIRTLYELEAGLFAHPYTVYHDIRREHDKSLSIYARFKKMVDTTSINALVAKAKVLGEMAVNVQRFSAARITFKTEDDQVLQAVVVV